MTTYSNVASIKVSPGIGMARVGNAQPANSSDRGFFYYGPETPNTTVQPPEGPYKDSSGRILRQAQRFRVFGYDSNGELVGEIVTGDTVNGTVVQINWTAHLTNMKAANYSFQGQYGFNPDQYRNSNIAPATPGTDPADRTALIIDPGPMSISGVSQGPTELMGPGSTIFDVPAGNYELPGVLRFDPPQNAGPNDMVPVTYNPVEVSLGKLYTDKHGRLIVVGGEGAAGSTTTPAVVISKITEPNNQSDDPQYNGNSYFNNPGWYDDTAGGSIDAALVSQENPSDTLFNTAGIAGATGWVGVSPPKYAPTAYNIVSLLDLQLDLFPEQDPYTGQGPVYYAAIGIDDGLYIAQAASVGENAFDFQGAATTSEVSPYAPALAVFGGKVFYAYIGKTGMPFIGSSDDGSPASFVFGAASPDTNQFIYRAPALAVFNGQLYYAFTGKDNRPYIGVSDSGMPGTFTFSRATSDDNQVTMLPPALAAFNGQLVYAFTSEDLYPFIGVSDDGSPDSFTFVAAASADQRTSQAPALAAFAGKLYYAITGLDNTDPDNGRPYLASADSPSEQAFDFQTVAPSNQVTQQAPALAAYNGQLVYAFTGENLVPFVGTAAPRSSPSISFSQASSQSEDFSSQFGPALAANEPANFYRDVFPLLKIATDYAWTSEYAYHGHRPGAQGDFLREPFLSQLADPSAAGATARTFVFNFLRPPTEIPSPAVPPPPAPAPGNVTAQETQRGDLMPRLTGNGGSVTENTVNGTNFPNQWLSLTNHQLSKIQRWVNGDFESGTPSDTRWAGLPADQSLDFAALQPTVGGGFHPGIELTYLMQEGVFFDSAFRFAAGTVPGSIAGYMSIPWQGDFWSCNTTFWPAARPDISIKSDTSQKPPLLEPRPWFRGGTIPPKADSISGYNAGYQTMADDWPRYGFVVPTGDTDQGEQVFKEIERDPSLDLPTLLVTVASDYMRTDNALAASSGLVVSEAEDTSAKAQQWLLVPSSVSPSLFYVTAAESGKVITVVSGGSIALAALAVPHDDSQLWQYVPSANLTPPGYPGVFYLQSRFNGEYLSVQGTSVVTAAESSSLVQLFNLVQASEDEGSAFWEDALHAALELAGRVSRG